MRDDISIGHFIEVYAEDHIRQAIMHLESYLATWWTEEEFKDKEPRIRRIIKKLEDEIG